MEIPEINLDLNDSAMISFSNDWQYNNHIPVLQVPE
jgi:hypothetical protein